VKIDSIVEPNCPSKHNESVNVGVSNNMAKDFLTTKSFPTRIIFSKHTHFESVFTVEKINK